MTHPTCTDNERGLIATQSLWQHAGSSSELTRCATIHVCAKEFQVRSVHACENVIVHVCPAERLTAISLGP